MFVLSNFFIFEKYKYGRKRQVNIWIQRLGKTVSAVKTQCYMSSDIYL